MVNESDTPFTKKERVFLEKSYISRGLALKFTKDYVIVLDREDREVERFKNRFFLSLLRQC